MTDSLFSQTFLLAAAAIRDAVWMKDARWWSPALMVIGLLALVTIVVRFVKMFRGATVCRVPLAATNEVVINRTGELLLRFETVKDSAMTGEKLGYKLFNRQQADAPIALKPVPDPLTVKSGQKRSFPVGIFQITETGKYLLKVSGIDSQTNYSGCSLVISRLLHLRAFLFVLGIVLTGLMFVGGLVLTIFAFSANK